MILNYLVPKEKLPATWNFSLNTYGYIAGVLGMIWRIIGVTLTSILLAATKSTDTPEIIDIVFVFILCYLLLTLIANILFITAIMKKWPYMLLPYLLIQGIELIGIVFTMISGCYVSESLDLNVGFWLLLSTCFCTLVIQGSLCYHSVKLFKNMEMTVALQKKLGPALSNKEDLRK